MTRSLKVSLLIASMLVVLWTTSSEACHWRRRACQPAQSYCQSGYGYGSPQGYYSSAQGGYTTTDGGYYGGSYSGGYGYGQPGYGQPGYGQPGYGQPGYDFGRPGYNPGGLGGPASGIGVRPGLGAAALARGADRPQALRSPCGGAPAWTYVQPRGSAGQMRMPRPVTARPGVTPVATRPFAPVDPPNRRGPSEAVPGAVCL